MAEPFSEICKMRTPVWSSSCAFPYRINAHSLNKHAIWSRCVLLLLLDIHIARFVQRLKIFPKARKPLVYRGNPNPIFQPNLLAVSCSVRNAPHDYPPTTMVMISATSAICLMAIVPCLRAVVFSVQDAHRAHQKLEKVKKKARARQRQKKRKE